MENWQKDIAENRLRIDAAIRFIDGLLEGLSTRPRMFVPGDLYSAEACAIHLLSVRAFLLGKDTPDIEKYRKTQYPDIPGSIRSIAYGSTNKFKDQENEAFSAAMKKMIDALK